MASELLERIKSLNHLFDVEHGTTAASMILDLPKIDFLKGRECQSEAIETRQDEDFGEVLIVARGTVHIELPEQKKEIRLGMNGNSDGRSYFIPAGVKRIIRCAEDARLYRALIPERSE